MSIVTNVILVTDVLEEEAVQQLDDWIIFEWGGDGLRGVSYEAGGNKVMEIDLYASAYNHFDVDGFVAKFHEIKWSSPRDVALLVKTEDGPLLTFFPLET